MIFEWNLADLLRCDNWQHRANTDALVGRIDEPTSADERAFREHQQADIQGIGCGIHHIFEGHVILQHARRVHVHLRHLDLFTVDRYIGNPGHIQQAGPDLPIGDHRQIHIVILIGGNADLHGPAGGRQRLYNDGRSRPRGQCWIDCRDALCHQLSGVNEVRARLEDKEDIRQVRHRP